MLLINSNKILWDMILLFLELKLISRPTLYKLEFVPLFYF